MDQVPAPVDAAEIQVADLVIAGAEPQSHPAEAQPPQENAVSFTPSTYLTSVTLTSPFERSYCKENLYFTHLGNPRSSEVAARKVHRLQIYVVQEMLSKISMLERENKALHEEILSLGLENLEIKMEKIYKKNNEKREDGGLGPCDVLDIVFASKHS